MLRHNENASLFEQTILLVSQTYKSLAYQQRMNILSTIIENNTKATKISRQKAKNVDARENIYLFGKQFEKKLIKVTSANQKSKSIFTGLHK